MEISTGNESSNFFDKSVNNIILYANGTHKGTYSYICKIDLCYWSDSDIIRIQFLLMGCGTSFRVIFN